MQIFRFFVYFCTALVMTGPSLAKANIFYQGPFEIAATAPRSAAQVYLPNQYDSQAEWPLVLLLHGYTGTGEAEDTYLGMRFRVSSRGYILVTPNGITNSQGKQFWNATDFCCDFERTNVNDVEYLTNLLTEVKSRYHVDSKRVYVIGHSNGGFMANRLACETENVFAGIASLAGGSFKNPADCRLKDPIPYLQIHAHDDDTVKYDDDPRYAGGTATVEQWIQRNGCARDRASLVSVEDFVLTIPEKDTAQTLWQEGCSRNAPVAFWSIQPFTSRLHNAHIPIFRLGFMESVLDFFFAHKQE